MSLSPYNMEIMGVDRPWHKVTDSFSPPRIQVSGLAASQQAVMSLLAKNNQSGWFAKLKV